MEEVTWFFNSDFEDRLFSDNQNSFISTKQTQEFEYFINFLEPESKIYTNKIYDNNYLKFFEEFTGHKLKTTKKRDKVKNWCQSYENTEQLKKFQDKSKTLMHFKSKNVLKHHIKEISKSDILKEDFLYKNPYDLSGIGHYSYPKDEKIIKKLLLNQNLIEEEKLNRVKDFSTLLQNQKVIGTYENYIDEFYQYKGTLLSPESILDESLKKEYEKALNLIKEYTQIYQGIYSIDSFTYKRQNKLCLLPICELNMRKTMGYTAIKLKEKYFNNYSHFKFLLKRNKLSIENRQVKKIFKDQVHLISPSKNIFQVWIIIANSLRELEEKEKELISAFF